MNPYLGLLHDGAEDYETLVYDLIEPFRPFVDRMVIRMINRHEIRQDSFEQGEKKFWMIRDATQRVVRAFEETMRERVGSSTVGDVMVAQVRALRGVVSGEGGFWLFRWTHRETVALHMDPINKNEEGRAD